MASVHERTRSDGTLTWQVKWREAGRNRSVTTLSKPAATRIKRLVDAHGTYLETMAAGDGPTVEEWADRWLAHMTRANADTIEGYRRMIAKHITPVLGELAVSALTRDVVAVWANGLAGRHKTRANVFSLLSGMCEAAVPEWLPSSPCRGIRLREDDQADERPMLTVDELALILVEIPDAYRPFVAFLAGTGLRWGEATALTVASVDLRNAKIRVTRAVKHGATLADEAKRPKTKRSVRWVDLAPQLLPLLAAQVKGKAPGDLVFVNSRGHRLRNSTFHTTLWQPALNRAQANGLTHRPRIHDLRAFAVTQMIGAGVAPDLVADQLGHESTNTTLGIYRRLNPERGRVAAAAMGGVFAELETALALTPASATPQEA